METKISCINLSSWSHFFASSVPRYMLTWHDKCPLRFVVDPNLSPQHSRTAHMLQVLASRPIKRLVAAIACKLQRRMTDEREAKLRRITREINSN